MGRLSIIIADSDRDYLKSLERFLIVNYPKRFEIYTFSSHSKLSDHLSSASNIDILVLGQQLYQKNLKIENVMLVLLLSEERSEDCSKAWSEVLTEARSEDCSNLALGQGDEVKFVSKKTVIIKKYQHMDRFIAEIIRLYAANGQRSRGVTPMQGNTRAVSILSPSGGSGKSSIAAGCSVLCAGRGIRSFYLNLENIPSTDLFFHGDSTQSFSNAIFYLKGKGANLSLRLEGAKSIDIGSQVHYFKPPENIQELNELTEQDAVCLVSELKNNGVYDIIFIDTSCGLSPINTAIIKNSDIILLVMSPDRCSELKLKEFMAGLALLERKSEVKLAGKIIPVFNRVVEGTYMYRYREILDGRESRIEISDYPCRGFSDRSSGLIENQDFLSELSKVTDYLLSRSTVEVNNRGGGESIA